MAPRTLGGRVGCREGLAGVAFRCSGRRGGLCLEELTSRALARKCPLGLCEGASVGGAAPAAWALMALSQALVLQR